MALWNKEKVNTATKLDEDELFGHLISDYSSTTQYQVLAGLKNGQISEEQFKENVTDYAERIYGASEEQVEHIFQDIIDKFLGYGILTDLLKDDEITDIHCISYDCIRIKRKGHREGCNLKFDSPEDYDSFIENVAIKNNINISNLNAIQRFTDHKSIPGFIIRFTLVTGLLSTPSTPYLCIRKVREDFYSMDELEEMGMFDDFLKELLINRFVNGSTIICGSNSSGKTTLLNALKETIPDDVSVLISQQADELTTKNHPDMMFLHSLADDGEGEGSYNLKDISIAGLTMDIDFFIIGEIKGDEAMYFLNAAYTGQKCAGTIHGFSADKAIDKLIDYAMVGSRYTKTELNKMMTCFQTVIFMKDFKVSQVYAVIGYDKINDEIKYQPLYEHGHFVGEA